MAAIVFDDFLTFGALGLSMALPVQSKIDSADFARLQATRCEPVVYRVSRDLLSLQTNPAARPRLVTIPAKAVVELIGLSCMAGFVELSCENRTYMIFEADLTRLEIERPRIIRKSLRRTA